MSASGGKTIFTVNKITLKIFRVPDGVPETIKRLVDSFERNINTFKAGSINETQLRREYLDPFFTSLGWDVENKQGYADAYKDVLLEYSLKTKDVREALDYCCRISETRDKDYGRKVK